MFQPPPLLLLLLLLLVLMLLLLLPMVMLMLLLLLQKQQHLLPFAWAPQASTFTAKAASVVGKAFLCRCRAVPARASTSPRTHKGRRRPKLTGTTAEAQG